MDDIVALMNSLDQGQFSGTLDDTLLHRLSSTLQCQHCQKYNSFWSQFNEWTIQSRGDSVCREIGDVRHTPIVLVLQRWLNQALIAIKTDSLVHPELLKVLFILLGRYRERANNCDLVTGSDTQLAGVLRELIVTGLKLSTAPDVQMSVIESCCVLLPFSNCFETHFILNVFTEEVFSLIMKLDINFSIFQRHATVDLLARLIDIFSHDRVESIVTSMYSLLVSQDTEQFLLEILVKVSELHSESSATSVSSKHFLKTFVDQFKTQLITRFTSCIDLYDKETKTVHLYFYFFYMNATYLDDAFHSFLHLCQERLTSPLRVKLLCSLIRLASSSSKIQIDFKTSILSPLSRETMVQELWMSLNSQNMKAFFPFVDLLSPANLQQLLFDNESICAIAKITSAILDIAASNSSNASIYIRLLSRLPLSLEVKSSILKTVLEAPNPLYVPLIESLVKDLLTSNDLAECEIQKLFVNIFPEKLVLESKIMDPMFTPFSFSYSRLVPLLSYSKLDTLVDFSLLLRCQKSQLESHMESNDLCLLTCVYFLTVLNTVLNSPPKIGRERFLADPSVPTLLTDLLNMTGDSSAISGDFRELLLALSLFYLVYAPPVPAENDCSKSQTDQMIDQCLHLSLSNFDYRLSHLTRVLRFCFIGQCQLSKGVFSCLASILESTVDTHLLDVGLIDDAWLDSIPYWISHSDSRGWVEMSDSLAVCAETLASVGCHVTNSSSRPCGHCGESIVSLLDNILVAKEKPSAIDCVGD